MCLPFASKAWCQKEIARIIEEEEKNIEIKIETVCQHECLGRSMVAHATMDKEEEISKKIINVSHEN